ncbi:MAG: alpha/beta hydrolase [Lachnospiraceae bacterium]|nr:alpha/beta hydrolase [Lachnospiraceae bacterium]
MVIVLDNHVIYYEHVGKGRPLVLLHGNGEDHHIFDRLISELSEEYEIFAVDSRGHGMSAKEEEYHYKDMAEDVIRLIVELEINRPLICGFSDGGILALLVAIDRSDLISGLIVCGANLNPKGLTLGSRMQIKGEYRKNKSPLTEMMLKEPDISPSSLVRITVPTLVLAGEKDMVKESHTKLIAASIQGAKLQILSGEDHGSYVCDSIKLADFIRQM